VRWSCGQCANARAYTAVEDDFAPAGVPTPGEDVNEVNPQAGPDGDITEEGMVTPIAPS
jgi:hypothetical protein